MLILRLTDIAATSIVNIRLTTSFILVVSETYWTFRGGTLQGALQET